MATMTTTQWISYSHIRSPIPTVWLQKRFHSQFTLHSPNWNWKNGYNQHHFALDSTFFEAELQRLWPGRGQNFGLEAVWIRDINITGYWAKQCVVYLSTTYNSVASASPTGAATGMTACTVVVDHGWAFEKWQIL